MVFQVALYKLLYLVTELKDYKDFKNESSRTEAVLRSSLF